MENRKVYFRVWPAGGKPRTYSNLADVKHDYTRMTIAQSSICLVIGATVIDYLDSKRISMEL